MARRGPRKPRFQPDGQDRPAEPQATGRSENRPKFPKSGLLPFDTSGRWSIIRLLEREPVAGAPGGGSALGGHFGWFRGAFRRGLAVTHEHAIIPSRRDAGGQDRLGPDRYVAYNPLSRGGLHGLRLGRLTAWLVGSFFSHPFGGVYGIQMFPVAGCNTCSGGWRSPFDGFIPHPIANRPPAIGGRGAHCGGGFIGGAFWRTFI